MRNRELLKRIKLHSLSLRCRPCNSLQRKKRHACRQSIPKQRLKQLPNKLNFKPRLSSSRRIVKRRLLFSVRRIRTLLRLWPNLISSSPLQNSLHRRSNSALKTCVQRIIRLLKNRKLPLIKSLLSFRQVMLKP